MSERKDCDAGSSPPLKTAFAQWCEDQGLTPLMGASLTNPEASSTTAKQWMRLMEQAFYAGKSLATKPEAPSQLRLTAYTNTIMMVYKERDRYREEVKDLTKALGDAVKINGKFHNVLGACKGLVDSYDYTLPDEERLRGRS